MRCANQLTEKLARLEHARLLPPVISRLEAGPHRAIGGPACVGDPAIVSLAEGRTRLVDEVA